MKSDCYVFRWHGFESEADIWSFIWRQIKHLGFIYITQQCSPSPIGPSKNKFCLKIINHLFSVLGANIQLYVNCTKMINKDCKMLM